jgi:patatin-like phospholipase/acyl hydrolase
LVDAVLRTTAAPTYFPIYQGYIDGGVVANNPSLVAYSTLLASEIVQPQDVVVLSMSTGSNPKGIPKSKYGKGEHCLMFRSN